MTSKYSHCPPRWGGGKIGVSPRGAVGRLHVATPDRPLSYRAWLTPRGAGVRSNDHISHGLGDPGVPPRLSPPRSSDWGGCYRRYGRASRGLPGFLGASRPDFGTGGPRPTLNFTLARGCSSAKNLLIVYRPLPQLGSP